MRMRNPWWHVFMEAASDGASSGSTGGSSAANNAGDGTGGGAGQAAAATAQSGGDPSLLSQALAAANAQAGADAGAAGSADPLAFIPDKFKVNGADGQLDAKATLAKALASYTELEKRVGAGAAPPASADEYKPDAVLAKLKEATGQDIKLDDAQSKAFRDTAHKLGLSQAQYEGIVGAYFENVQGMVDTAFDNAMAKGAEALSKAWGAKDGEPFKANMGSAVKAFMKYAPAEMRTQQVMDQIGNNPVVLQVLAAVGKELREDVRPNAGGVGADDIAALQKSEAYWNTKHADHQRVVNKVNAYYQAGGKNAVRAA